MKEVKFIRKVHIMLLDSHPETVSITCRCKHRWIETDVPAELTALEAVLIFTCPRCGQQYGRYKNKLARMLSNGQPDMDSLIPSIGTMIPPTGGGNA